MTKERIRKSTASNLARICISRQIYVRANKEKVEQAITNKAKIGERVAPEDECVEVVGVVVEGVLTAGVDGVPVPVPVPDGAVVDALSTVTESFMPLPQWPATPQMK